MINPLANLLTTSRKILTTIGRLTVSTLRTTALSITAAGRTLWAVHRQLMNTHALYRGTVTAFTGVVLLQLDLERLILALVSALLRHLTRTPPRPDNPNRGHDRLGDLYSDDPDGWDLGLQD